MKQIIAAIMLLTALSACSYVTKPEPYGLKAGMVDGAPPGTPGFRYGWKNGCESGLAAYGTMTYKVAYDYKYDSTALQDNEYQNAWEMGFRHCRWYTSSWVG